jgi:hypothetical protein
MEICNRGRPGQSACSSYLIDKFHTGLPLDHWPFVTGLSFVQSAAVDGIFTFYAVL